MISDVPGDDPAVIGSGSAASLAPARTALPRTLPVEVADVLARCPVPRRGRAAAGGVRASSQSNRHARVAARHRARSCGRLAVRSGRGEFAGDAADLGRTFARRIAAAAPGTVWIWGGESTVVLPASPGRGGRNQQLALAAALAMARRDRTHAARCGDRRDRRQQRRCRRDR